jgi:hypothetical protein
MKAKTTGIEIGLGKRERGMLIFLATVIATLVLGSTPDFDGLVSWFLAWRPLGSTALRTWRSTMSKPRARLRTGLSTLVLLLGLPGGLAGQGAAASLSGKVVGPEGTSIAGATVAAITQDGRVIVSTTNGTGRYVIRRLPLGTYTIWAGKRGRGFYERDSLRLASRRTRTLDISLSKSSVMVYREMARVRGRVQMAGALPVVFSGGPKC